MAHADEPGLGLGFDFSDIRGADGLWSAPVGSNHNVPAAAPTPAPAPASAIEAPAPAAVARTDAPASIPAEAPAPATVRLPATGTGANPQRGALLLAIIGAGTGAIILGAGGQLRRKRPV